MLRNLTKIAALALAVLAVQPASAQTLFRPVAVVNDSAITGFDLAQRAQIMVALGFSAASPDALRAEALDNLVEDRLKLQAGEQIGIRPTADIIEVGIAEFLGPIYSSPVAANKTLYVQTQSHLYAFGK